MSSTSHRESLRSALEALGLGPKINQRPPFENIDLALSTPCYQAFFKIIERTNTLRASWQGLQEDVARYKFEEKHLPRDLYLTFLLMDAVDVDDIRTAQAISADPMVCRKIILYAAETSLSQAIESLPFIAIGAGTAGAAPTIQQAFSALHASGYPSEILETISERASVENILARLLDLPIPSEIPSIQPEAVTLQASGAIRPNSSRLRQVTIKDFRGVRTAKIDLSANLTVIYGPNGTGKTSIFDAIEWVLLGSVERLEAESPDDMSGLSPYINLFSEKPETVVTLAMESLDGEIIRISRAGGLTQESSLTLGDGKSIDDRQLLTAITGQEGAKLDLRVLRRLIRSTCCLSQSTLKNFLSNDPSQRYWSLSHLLGTQDYLRILDKLHETSGELDVRVADLQQEIDSSQRDISQITDQIQARRSLLDKSIVLRDSETALRELTQRTAESLQLADSPYTALFQSVTGYEETQSSVSISVDWVEKELKRRHEEREKLTVAKDALVRNKEIEIALKSTGADHKETATSLKGKEQQFNATRSEIDKKQSEIKSLSDKIQALTRRQGQIREAILLSTQMRSIVPLLREQEDQSRLAERALQDALTRKGPLAKESESLLQAHKQATEKLTRLRTQLTLLDELESSSTTYIQLLQERPSLQQELRTNLQKIAEQETAKASTTAQLAGLQEELRTNNSEREKQLGSIERFRGLVLELQQYLTDPDCPLCGHSWASVEALNKAVSQRSAWMSPQLRELERMAKELQRRIEIADVGLHSSEQEIATLASRQRDLETRLRSADENERSFRHRLERIGLQASASTDMISAMAVLRARNDAEIALSTAAIAALEGGISQLRDFSAAIDAELANLEEQAKRARVRLVDTQRRLNDLTQQFSELELAIPHEQAELDRELEKCGAESQALTSSRSRVLADVESLSAQLQHQTLELESLRRKDKEYSNNTQNLQTILDRTKAALLQVQLTPESSDDDVLLCISRTSVQISHLEKARTNLREMDQITSWLVSRRQIEQLTGQLNQLSAKAQGLAQHANRFNGWHAHLSGLHSAILAAKARVETLQLAQYGPTMNLLYQRLNTHPLFREIRVLIDPSAQLVKINLAFPQGSPVSRNIPSLPPALYLSEAQLNVVALTIFLSHSFQQRWSRFYPLLLDDPVMNLDDFNANGLIDCLRTFAETGRQFVISTCDVGFYRLLLLKLRCMNQGDQVRFRAYRLDGISTSGPSLVRDCPSREEIAEEKEILQ